MVDTIRRKKLALHLRHLSVGLISNDDFESLVMGDVSCGWLPEQYFRSKESIIDDAVMRPLLELCWGLYTDTERHKLVKSYRLSPEALRIIARCILFLHSENEYQWPYFNTQSVLYRSPLKTVILSILTLGHYFRKKNQDLIIAYENWKSLGDFEVWPFFKQSEYQEQLKRQPSLIGLPDKGAGRNKDIS